LLVTAKVKHTFHNLMRILGFDIVRYWDREEHHRLCTNFALVNLYLHRKRLADSHRSAPEIGLKSRLALQNNYKSDTPPTPPTQADQTRKYTSEPLACAELP
jgi:hypothetical protein